MPVTVSYPGVYIEEIPSGVRTITGVATSIAAFFGRAKEGPFNKAIRLLSYADYERVFGPPDPGSELATSVRLFFQNGGNDCYVTRLVKAGTGQKASLEMKNENDQAVLKFEAKEIGTWGNELALEVDYDTSQPEETFHLRIYRIGDNGAVKATEEFLNCSMDIDSPHFPPKLLQDGSRLVNCKHTLLDDNQYRGAASASTPGYSQSRRPFTKDKAGLTELRTLINDNTDTGQFRLSVDDSAFYEVNLAGALANIAQNADWDTTTEGEIQTRILEKINNALPPSLQGSVSVSFATIRQVTSVTPPATETPALVVLSLTSNTMEKKSVIVQPASSKDLSGKLMLGTAQGGIERSKYASLRPAASGLFLKSNKLDDLANLTQNHFDKITLDGEKVDLGVRLTTTGASDKWYQGGTPGNKNFDGVREKLAILARAISDAEIGWNARVVGSRLQLQKKSGPGFAIGTITTASGDIANYFGTNTRYYSLGINQGNFQSSATVGQDGGAPDVAAFKGNPTAHSGLHALDVVDLFNLVIIPRDNNLTEGNYQELWASASAYCKDHRAFLLIDPPDSWSASYREVTDQSHGIRKLRTGIVKDYSTVFYPRIKVRENGLLKSVGPAGVIAGVMARTDAARGVWKAPAGTDAALNGVFELDVLLTDLENGVLNKEGVNCLRSFPVGIVNWGARTLDGADDFASEWKYIPVRRTALFIEESLYRGLKWVVFEPNDEPLWAQIRLNVGAFMQNLFRQGAFQGKTPREAYFVKCDRETTTQNDINLGIVNIVVGFAPLKPAEFVIIKLQQMAGQIEV